MLEPFTAAVEVSSGDLREVLTLLRDLFALGRIEEDRKTAAGSWRAATWRG